MRIAVAGLSHEANTFASTVADLGTWQEQGIFVGDEIRAQHLGARSIIAGYLQWAGEQPDVELVPLYHSKITATGPSTAEAFEALSGGIVAALHAGGPWDGVLLSLHGAAVSEAHPDADGELLRRVRHAVGPDVPIGVTLDLHANVSDLMVESATIITLYQTNPHVDAFEQGLECATLLGRTLRGDIRPVMSIVRLPLAINILRQGTDEQPMAALIAAAREAEHQPGVLSVSLVEGFPYADVAEMGMAVVAIADDDPGLARTVATRMARLVWNARDEMTGPSPDAHEALRLAAAEPAGPVIVLDMGDNVGGGGPGDSTLLLHAARDLGIADVTISIADPVVVAECIRAGVGARVALEVGGRTDHRHGAPFPVEGEVIALSDGVFDDPTPTHGGLRRFDVGQTVGIRTDEGMLLAVHARPAGAFSRVQWQIAGIEPSSVKIVIAKGVHSPRAAFEPIASRLIWADTRGVTSADLTAFEYEYRARPMFPFERDAEWGE